MGRGAEVPLVFNRDANELKIGDCVSLMSGGPPMTVTAVDETDNIDVAWFDGDRMRRRHLPAAALIRCNLKESQQ